MANRMVSLNEAIVKEFRDRVARDGAMRVAREIGVTKETVYKIAGGFDVTAHMAALISQNVKVSPL